MKKRLAFVILGMFVILATNNLLAQNQHQNHHQGGKPNSAAPKDTSNCIHKQEMGGERHELMQLPDLTEDQKTALKKIHTDFMDQSLALRNQVNELNAKKTTLLSQGNEVTGELTTVIEQINNTKSTIDLLRAKEVMSIKAKLTPAQKSLFNTRIQTMGDERVSRRNRFHEKGNMNDGKKGPQNSPVDNDDSDDLIE